MSGEDTRAVPPLILGRRLYRRGVTIRDQSCISGSASIMGSFKNDEKMTLKELQNCGRGWPTASRARPLHGCYPNERIRTAGIGM